MRGTSPRIFSIGRVRNAGFPTDGRRFLLDKVVEEPGTMHEVERFFRLAHGAIKAWGGTPAWDSVPEELGMRLLARHEAAARIMARKSSGSTSTNSADRFATWA